MVINGYITREAFHDIYDHIDAANIDLKAFTENFYGRITLTHLKPVLETLEWLKNETNVWFEITNLMIPTLNDDAGRNTQARRMDPRTSGPGRAAALHRVPSRFQIARQAAHAARNAARARAIAREAGLHYVYEGNIYQRRRAHNCPRCGTLLIRRSWHDVQQNNLRDGCCPKCGLAIPGRWTNPPVLAGARVARKAESIATKRYGELNL